MPASQDGPGASRRWQPLGLRGSPGSPCPSLAAPVFSGRRTGAAGDPGAGSPADLTVLTCTLSLSPRGSPERVGATEHPSHPHSLLLYGADGGAGGPATGPGRLGPRRPKNMGPIAESDQSAGLQGLCVGKLMLAFISG